MSLLPEKGLAFYFNRYALYLTYFGFASAVPAGLIFFITSSWVADVMINKQDASLLIGVLSWAGLPFSFKVFLSPVLEVFHLKVLTRWFGRTRGWILCIQCALLITMLCISGLDPARHSWWLILGLWCFMGLWGALQDVLLETYRIENTPFELQETYAGMNAFGFRLGISIVGFISYIGADKIGWPRTFLWISGYFLISICIFLGMPKKEVEKPLPYSLQGERSFLSSFRKQYTDLLKAPVAFFKTTYGLFGVLGIYVSYKIADVFMRPLITPFMKSIGYTMSDIAYIDRGTSIVSTLIGIALATYWFRTHKVRTLMCLWSLLQLTSGLLYFVQYYVGYHYALSLVTFGVVHCVTGIGGAVALAYLATLCRAPGMAGQYAFIVSFGSVARTVSTFISPLTMRWESWEFCLIANLLACLPMVGFAFFSKEKFWPVVPKKSSKIAKSSPLNS